METYRLLVLELLTNIKTNNTIDSKFSELAQHVMEILRYSEKMREDCKMIFLTHCENVGDTLNPKYVIKTIGKLLSEKVTLEGLFTYIFFAKSVDGDNGIEYKFLTNTDGTCVAKTPLNMYKSLTIDNDLNDIIKVIDWYNNGDEDEESPEEIKSKETKETEELEV